MKNASLKLTFLFILISFFACRKDVSETPFVDIDNVTTTIKTNISGRVFDPFGLPLANSKLSINGETTYSDIHGIFLFKDISVSQSRVVIHCNHTVYGDAVKGFIPSKNVTYTTINYAKSQLSPAYTSSTTNTFSTQWGSTVTIPAGALIDENNSIYNGSFFIKAIYLNPDSADFAITTPGGDLLSDDNKVLISYGMTNVELIDASGNKLKLNGSAIAEVSFPVAASQTGNAPATIALWHLDETTALWRQEGTATRVGNNYIANVTHFSWWNCDIGEFSGRIMGRVVDCDGFPIPNVIIRANGSYTTSTNSQGNYYAWIPSSTMITLQVTTLDNPFYTVPSNIVTIGPASPGQTIMVPDLAITCLSFGGTLNGTIVDCDGDLVQGMIYYTYGGAASYYYVVNGILNLMAPSDSTVTLEISNGLSLLDTAFIMPHNGIDLSVGNIILCDPVSVLPPLADNTIYINGGPWQGLILPLDTTDNLSFSGQLNSGSPQVPMNIKMGANFPDYFRLYLSENTIGNYFLAPVSCYVNYISLINNIYIDNFASSGSFNISYVGLIGDRIKGSFDVNVIATDNSNGHIYVVQCAGRFNVPHTQ